MELERLEFGGEHPELMIPNTPLHHPLTLPYRRALRADMGFTTTADYRGAPLGKNPNKQLAAAEANYASEWAEFQRRKKLRAENFYDGGLRRLIDAEMRAYVASHEVWWIRRQIEQAKQDRKAAREKEKRDRSNAFAAQITTAIKQSIGVPPHGRQ